MNRVRKLDSRRRGVFPDCFSPGDLFLEEEVARERVVFRRIRAAEEPPAQVVRMGGMLMVKALLDLERIRAALREERDAR